MHIGDPRQPASDDRLAAFEPLRIDSHPDPEHQLVALDLGLDGFRSELRLAGDEHHLGGDDMVGISERHQAARDGYFTDAAFDPVATRAALTKLTAPVLLYAGSLDPMVTPALVREAAPLFNDATVVVQPGAGHYPWIDDPAAFAAAIGAFLS